MKIKPTAAATCTATTRLRKILLAGLSATKLASCGGSDAFEELFCDPPPQITSTPPVVATVGREYRYSVDATRACDFYVIPLRCSGADPLQLPAGAEFLDSSDLIRWTPAPNQANTDVQFAVASEPDLCERRAAQSWTVRVHAAPVVDSFVAAKTTLVPGESTVLTGVFQGTGRIDDLGPIVSGVPVSTPPLNTRTSYTLFVTNDVGVQVQRTITIEVMPNVVSTNPVNGATEVPANRALNATFSKTMNGASINSSTFLVKDSNNNPVSGTVTFAGNVATFTPANSLAVLSQYTAMITNGARDLDGNPMIGNYVWSFATGAALDTLRPTVTSSFPANEADRVDPERIRVIAIFSESIDPSSVNSSTFIVKNSNHIPVNGAFRVTNGGNTAEFMSTTPLASSMTYTAIATTGIKDLAGNAMAADHSWSFSTASLGAWQATSTTGAPSARWSHTAVWTGREMIVWGGYDNSSAFNSGARYNPVTDTWLPTSSIGAPPARAAHTAVWTGSEMIVWGGGNGHNNRIDTNARYNAATDTWTPISSYGAPSARSFHTAVWTGSEMIIWGGVNYTASMGDSNTGARYNPASGVWAPISNIGAPSARYNHTAVWTGSEMIIWGGSGRPNFQNTGARYNPATDTWLPMSTSGAPTSGESHTSVWTGSELIVWGAANSIKSLGARYNPITDAWLPTSHSGEPFVVWGHTTVWTGSKMIAWGGNSISDSPGARYNPVTDSWLQISNLSAPSARYDHTAVWTGSEMIVWGGASNDAGNLRLNSGGRYRP